MANDQTTKKQALAAAIEVCGGQAGLARIVGVTGSSPRAVVWAWMERGQAAQDFCPAIERATDGVVICEELRPDITWARVPDPDWPHPSGRPCIDVAAPEAA